MIRTKLHYACSSDMFRETMQFVYFKDGHAYATDGFILVREKLEPNDFLTKEQIDLLDGKMVHKGSIPLLQQSKVFGIGDDGITITRRTQGDTIKIMFYSGSSKYPDAISVLDNVIRESMDLHAVSKVNINSAVLRNLIRVIGTNTFEMHNGPTDHNAILIRCKNMPVIGLIMPCKE